MQTVSEILQTIDAMPVREFDAYHQTLYKACKVMARNHNYDWQYVTSNGSDYVTFHSPEPINGQYIYASVKNGKIV